MSAMRTFFPMWLLNFFKHYLLPLQQKTNKRTHFDYCNSNVNNYFFSYKRKTIKKKKKRKI